MQEAYRNEDGLSPEMELAIDEYFAVFAIILGYRAINPYELEQNGYKASIKANSDDSKISIPEGMQQFFDENFQGADMSLVKVELRQTQVVATLGLGDNASEEWKSSPYGFFYSNRGEISRELIFYIDRGTYTQETKDESDTSCHTYPLYPIEIIGLVSLLRQVSLNPKSRIVITRNN